MAPVRHLVRTAEEAAFEVPPGFADLSEGYIRWTIVNAETGSHHQEFNICELQPGGHIGTHIQTFEESVYIIEGEVICETGDGQFLMRQGDYGVVHVAAPHALRNVSDKPVRWAEMLAPQPRLDRDSDIYAQPAFNHEGPPITVDPRDPRTRFFGNITKQHMNPSLQSQELLSVSGSMRTALMVYTGITVKMMVDGDMGAYLHTTFMVEYEPGGGVGPHDHPFEETYMIIEGVVDAFFDGNDYRLKPGDVAFSASGCIHGFRGPVDSTVRWLETSAPQPPARYAYRFGRDWNYLEDQLKK